MSKLAGLVPQYGQHGCEACQGWRVWRRAAPFTSDPPLPSRFQLPPALPRRWSSVLLGGSLVSFSCVECVLLFSALTGLRLWLRPSRDLTGSSTRGEADSMQLAGCGAGAHSTSLGGGLMASSPHRSLGRCWAAVRRACRMSRSWHTGTGWVIFICFRRQSRIR
jgi:hypothetical protein